MSTTLQNPAYYSEEEGPYAPVALMPADDKLTEKIAEKVAEKPVAQVLVQKPVLPIKPATPPLANTIPNITRAFSAFFKIVTVGVALFLMGAIAIFIYFSAHPVLYKSNGLETFELKRILADEPEVTTTDAKPSIEPTASAAPTSSPVIPVKNNTIDDYILSIQPKVTPPKDEALIAHDTIKSETVKTELKNEATPALAISTAHPNIDAHGVQAKNIANDEKAKVEKTREDKTKLEKNNNILLKLVDGIAEHGVKESVCDNAMRALNQCH